MAEPCGICHDQIVEAGELDCCFHRFCYPCICKWSSIETSCPFCKKRFEEITRIRLAGPLPANGPLPGTVISKERVKERNQRVQFEDPNFDEYLQTLSCVVCGSSEDEHLLLLCDGCDVACHTYCAGLESVPENEWFCEACTVARRAQNRRRQARDSGRLTNNQRSARISPDEVILLDDSEEETGRQRQTSRRRQIIVDSDDEEEYFDALEEPPRRRQRTTATGRSRGGRTHREMDGFIVDDDGEFASSGDEEFDDDERSRGRRTKRQQPSQRATRRNTTRGNRNQRRRRRNDEDEIELDDEELWVDSDDETEQEAASSDETIEDEEEILLATEGWRRKQNSERSSNRRRPSTRNTAATTRATRRAATGNGRRSRVGRATAAARVDTNAVINDGSNNTTDHRRVADMARNWEAIRAGTADFDDVRRTRQRVNTVDMIDLTIIPSPSLTRKKDGKKPASNQRLKDVVARAGFTSANSMLSPPLGLAAMRGRGGDGNRDMQQERPEHRSFSAQLRAELASASDRGAQRRLVNQQLGNASRNNNTSNNTATPGSAGRRMRTVADLTMSAQIVRNVQNSGGRATDEARPNSSGRRPAPYRSLHGPSPLARETTTTVINSDGRSSPPPLAERLAARMPPGPSIGNGWRRAQREPSPQRRQTNNDRFAPPTFAANPPTRAYSPRYDPTPRAARTTTPPVNLAAPVRTDGYVDINLTTRNNNVAASATENPKDKAYSLVKPHVRLLFDDGVITAQQYKEISRLSTRSLADAINRHGNMGVSNDEVKQAVDAAFCEVVHTKGGTA